MNHTQAVQSGAVDKYLLNELSAPERDAFEEHYFGCPECAHDLRATAEFLAVTRRELGQRKMANTAPARVPFKRSWLEWLLSPALLAPALAVVLAVVAYQNGVVFPRVSQQLAQLRQPSLITAVSLIGAASRGGSEPAVMGAAGQAVVLSLDIPAAHPYPAYECDLVDAAGKRLWQVPVSAAQAQDTVSISVPPGVLGTGDYALIVLGLSAPDAGVPQSVPPVEVTRYRFALGASH